MYDLVIIGGGPAGISAALYAVRAALKVAVVYRDAGALAKAERIENFYGMEPNGGEELFNAGISRARTLGADIINEEIVSLTLEENFKINELEARAVLIATGASRVSPEIPGLKKFEGRGVSYCAVCDAFFYRGKDTAVLGNGAYALHEAEALLPVVRSVTILTDGKEPEWSDENADPALKIITEPVAEICGEKKLEQVCFKNGEPLPVSGLFVAVGVAGGTDLARKIGAVIKDGHVLTDTNMKTSVPGLWAAGDCTGGMKQIAKAVHDGAVAGTDIIKSLRGKNI